MSAAIVKYWFNKTNQHGTLIMLGWDYGNPIPALIKDDVIMVDISFPKEKMLELSIYGLTWIDHHVSAIKEMQPHLLNGLTDTKFSACELTWMHLFPGAKMPEPIRLLGRYDCFGHKGTKEEFEVLWYQYYARTFFKSPDDCMRLIDGDNIDASMSIGRSIYRYLCTEAEADYKNIFEWNYNGIRIACINRMRFNPINFGIAYHNDGYDAFLCFHYANKKWNFSMYNDNGRVDCSVICKQFGGGGHAGASGFVSDNLNILFN
jgi:hypothetical protein